MAALIFRNGLSPACTTGMWIDFSKKKKPKKKHFLKLLEFGDRWSLSEEAKRRLVLLLLEKSKQTARVTRLRCG